MELTKNNFEQEVLNSDKPVLVDFWAPWCGPCRMQAPIVEDVAKELSGKVAVGKVNIDNDQELAVQYGIMSIPTLLVFNGGKVVAKSVGVTPKDKLVSMLDNN